jgi:glutathione S-transferase
MRLHLYETHLPVRSLERSIPFYEKLGLELAWRGETAAFFWIEKGKSWLGLWEPDRVETPYHPSLRHFAFGCPFEEIEGAIAWLQARGIQPKKDAPFEPDPPTEPSARPYQANASVYFDDPDGNSLEVMCTLPGLPDPTLGRMPFSAWKPRR